jgi:FkbM family methyltransferase
LARSFDRVTAFEPMPEHADCFTLNLNGYDNVRLHQCALGERTTPIRISLIADDIASAMVSDEGDVEVVMKPLDTFDLEDVDFLKIDAEGYAIPVLLGGEETIRRDKPVIVVEQKGADSRYGNAKFAAVDILKAWGARVALKMKGDYALTWDDA